MKEEPIEVGVAALSLSNQKQVYSSTLQYDSHFITSKHEMIPDKCLASAETDLPRL